MLFDLFIYGGIGYVAGAFTPSVGRSIKGAFSKSSTVAAVGSAASTAASKAASTVATDVVSAAKKV